VPRKTLRQAGHTLAVSGDLRRSLHNRSTLIIETGQQINGTPDKNIAPPRPPHVSAVFSKHKLEKKKQKGFFGDKIQRKG